MTRTIKGLVSAELCERPRTIPVGRPRGVKARGMNYEKNLAKVCGGAMHGQWIKFVDANGPGYAQPDFIYRGERNVLVLEAKLTWTPDAYVQLNGLYLPLVTKIWGLPAIGVQVCKNLTPEARRFGTKIVPDLRTAIEFARGGGPVAWHWLEKSVVGTPKVGASPRPRCTRSAIVAA